MTRTEQRNFELDQMQREAEEILARLNALSDMTARTLASFEPEFRKSVG